MQMCSATMLKDAEVSCAPLCRTVENQSNLDLVADNSWPNVTKSIDFY